MAFRRERTPMGAALPEKPPHVCVGSCHKCPPLKAPELSTEMKTAFLSHPERSEGSVSMGREILSAAKDDRKV